MLLLLLFLRDKVLVQKVEQQVYVQLDILCLVIDSIFLLPLQQISQLQLQRMDLKETRTERKAR